jgi:hypothetical protein
MELFGGPPPSYCSSRDPRFSIIIDSFLSSIVQLEIRPALYTAPQLLTPQP